MKRFLHILIHFCATAAIPALALTSADRVVPLSCEWTPPSSMTLTWSAGGQPLGYRIQRKNLLEAGWTTLTNLTNSASTFTDTNLPAGLACEYKVTRLDAVTNAWGFLYAGADLPPVHHRGTLLLVVESNTASALAPELARFRLDLLGDGWTSETLLAPRKNWNDPDWANSVTALHAQIKSAWSNAPAEVKGVFLFGHVPVPYSGVTNPDGHDEHLGAWPADCYYGDMDGDWTDLLHSPTNNARIDNRPGDGKFDPSYGNEFETDLMVGRVDLSSMPSFVQSEIELLRQYLAKEHQVRHRRVVQPERGLVNDQFGFFDASGEAFGQNGIRDFGLFYAPSNVAYGALFPAIRTTGYESIYGCGPGSYNSAGGVGTTLDFATGSVQAVFTMLFGSYFGDWDTTDNFLRAPLASTPSALTCVWAGRPKWYSHPMNLGEPIGTVFLLLQGLGYLDYEDELPLSGVQTALMGDPTLRLRYPAPPRHVAAVTNGANLVLTWDPPAETGPFYYAVSRAQEDVMVFSNLHAGLISGTAFTSTVSGITGVVFQVRAARRELGRSGSFTNLSQGVFVQVAADGTVNQPPVVTNQWRAVVGGTSLSIPLAGSDPDGDAIFTGLVSWPLTGSLIGPPTNLVYNAPNGFTGLVTFAYEAHDGWADSTTGLVTISVAPAATSRGTSGDWLIRTIGYAADYEQAEEEDPDGDGLPTWAEYRSGTDPLDAASVFSILGLDVMGSSNRLTWYGTTNSGVDSPFAIKKGTNLPDTGWAWVVSNLARHPSGTNSWTDTNLPARAFYRVLIP